MNETFNLFVRKGIDKVPTTVEFDAKGAPSWFNGKSTSIYKESKEVFCTNCYYKVLVEAPANSLMKLSVWTDDEVMKIALDDK